MAETPRLRYWGRYAAVATVTLGLLFMFIFGFLPQRFLLELDFTESDFAYPVINPPLPLPPTPPPLAVQRPTARGPAERFWGEYLPLARAGDYEAALQLLGDYLALYPDDLGAQLEYARTLWRAGQLEAAAAAYRKALASGADPEARRELARLYVAAHDWDRALALYEALVSARPRDPELLREFAEVATWAERYDRAIQVYSRLVELNPREAELRLQWARVLYWSGQPERAAQVLEGLPTGFAKTAVDSLLAAIAVALPPPDAEIISPLEEARELAMESEGDSALAVYRRLLREDPGAHHLLLEIAGVFEYRANAPDSAAYYLRTYLGLYPDAHDVRLRLARLMIWSGDLDAAEAELQIYVRGRPDGAEGWALLGDIHRWRGERRAASRAYRRALQIDPGEPRATQGLATLSAQLDAQLAQRGNIGPAGGFDYFADSEEFTQTRLRGSWLLGSPRTRGGVDVELESLTGLDPAGGDSVLSAVSVQATAERWLADGAVQATAAAGAWIPDGGVSAEPIVRIALSAPELGGGAYTLEYRHGPAHLETATLEAALAGLSVDVARLQHYRPLAPRWDLLAGARVARIAGFEDANLRGDASLGIFFKPDAQWVVGYDGRLLAFRDAAPNPGQRLYWDPKWAWENSLLLGWQGSLGPDWELEARLSPGFAWLEERGLDPAVAFLFGAQLGFRYNANPWILEGRTSFNQSRAGGYRALRLELGVSRRFGG